MLKKYSLLIFISSLMIIPNALSDELSVEQILIRLEKLEAEMEFLKTQLKKKLDNKIDDDKIVHVQSHHTPLYTVESVRYRHEVISTNGENHAYHAGAYLGDGLHEGAIYSAYRAADLLKGKKDVSNTQSYNIKRPHNRKRSEAGAIENSIPRRYRKQKISV